MADRRQPSTRVDDDGVRTTSAPRIRGGVWFAVAAIVVACLAALLTRSRQPTEDEDRPFRDGDVVQRRGAAPEPRRIAQRQQPPARVGKLPPRRDAVDAAAQSEGLPPAAAAGENYEEGAGGIGVFPPPGTQPLKRGIVVPEGFVLPDGFMRHYQSTDDGKELRAILMFHPDFKPLDEHGAPIEIPEDRVVPPELAPPGLEIEILDDPEPEIPLAEDRDGTPLSGY